MIRVYVFDKGRTNYYLRYIDPETGKPVDRSARTKDYGKAERAASKLEEQLNTGRGDPGRILWRDFRDRYESEHLAGLAKGTRRKWHDVANSVEACLRPQYVAEITGQRISRLVASLRAGDRSETTIDSHLATLKSALRWASDMRLIPACPKFPRVRRSKRNRSGGIMKGRPLTDAEFAAMLAAVPTALANAVGEVEGGQDRVNGWRFYLKALWLSGLRLDESLRLWWPDGKGAGDDALSIDLSGEFPMLRVPAEGEKGHRDRLMPIVPEFAEFLLAVPPEQRTGRVFTLSARKSFSYRKWHVSRVGSKIGRAAGIVVSTKGGKTKYGSVHDLRRSFGFRWSRRVMPPVLMELMRHESIETTMKYYVGVNADETARMLWGMESRRGDTFGDTPLPDTNDQP